MPPPPSYLDITATPYSQLVTQAQFNAGTYGGVANQCWFRYIAAAPMCLGVHTDRGGTFNPTIGIYQSDGSTLVGFAGTAAQSFYRELTPAGTFYVRVSQAGVSNFDFTFIADAKPLDGFVIPEGSVIINDDSNGPPATVYQLDGTLVGFLSAIPGGEIAAALTTGESIWQDRFGRYGAAGSFALFDDTVTFAASANPDAWGGFHTPAAASNTDFYVVYKTSALVYKITPLGIVTGPIATLVTGTPNLIFAFGVSPDGSIAYWAQKGDVPGKAHRHNLITDTAMTDLYATPLESIGITANGLPGEIFCLPDGTLVTWYGPLFGTSTLVHLSAAGALLQSYPFTAPFNFADHLSFADSLSEAANLWRLKDPFLEYGQFVRVTLATGAETGFTAVLFQTRTSLIIDDPAVLGASESCSWITFKIPVEPPSDNEIICIHGSAHGTLGLTGSYARAIGRVVV